MSAKIIKLNKFAGFKYFIEKKYEAGIVLTGPDVKAIKANEFDIRDAFVRETDGEMFLWNINFNTGNIGSQKRKLLLNRSEISKIHDLLKDRKNHGFVLSVSYNDKNKIKFELGFGRVKKVQEKRTSEKRSSEKRELERDIAKNY